MPLRMMAQMCPHGLFLTLLVVSLPASAQDFPDLFLGTITDDTYLFVGDDLELNCSLYDSSPQTYTAYNMIFMFQHQALGEWKCVPQNHVKVVNDKVATLVIQNVTSNNVGPYACYVGNSSCTDGDNSNKTLVSVSEDVFVEYAPHNVTDFQCEVYNWGDYLICTWQHPVNYTRWSDIEVSVVFMISGYRDAHKCPAPSKTNCIWTKDNVQLGNKYYIEITVKNTKNNATASKEFVVNTSAIVRPAPVQNFSIVASKENSSCLVLSWSHPDKHNQKIYTVKHENETLQNVTVTNFTSCGYLPYTRHNFSVQCYPIELYSGYWSEPVYASFLTPMTAPKSGPQAKNGSFMTSHYVGGSRNVTLMWQDVEAAARNGLIDHYLIKVNNTPMITVSADLNSANVLLPCYLSSQVEIFAHNEGGYSVKPTVLYIPPVTVTVPEKLQETFSVNMTANHDYRNSSTYRAMWQVSNGARDMNYTMFWCTGSPEKPCKGQIHWSNTIAGTSTYYDVHLQDSDVEKYIFGMSVTYSDTGASSGIFWTKCLFSDKPFSSHPQTVDDLQVQSGVEKADIFWSKIQCTYLSLTKVTGYKIKWCEVGSCNNTDGVSSVDVPATASMYTVSALTAHVKYNVTVQPVSYEDVGAEVKPWAEVIPAASENKASITMVIVISVVCFVILAGAVLCRVCKKRHNRSKELVPENFLPLSGAEPRAVLYTSSQATVRLLPVQSSNSVHLLEPPSDGGQDSPQGIYCQGMSTNLHNHQQSSSDPELLPSHSASAQSYHQITHTPPHPLSGPRDEHRNQESRMFQTSGTSAAGTDQMISFPFSQSLDIPHPDLGSVSSASRSLDSHHHFANCPPCSPPENTGVFSQNERTDQQLLLSGSGSLPSYQQITYCGSDQPCGLSDIHHVDYQHHSLPSNHGSLQTDLSSVCDQEAAYAPHTVIPLLQHTVSHLQYDNERSANRTIDHNPGIETDGNVNSHGPRPALTPAEPDTVTTLTPSVSAQPGHTTVDVEPSFEVGTEVNANPSETSLSGEAITLSHMQSSNDHLPLTSEAGQHPAETPGDSDFSSGSSAVHTEYIQMTAFHS